MNRKERRLQKEKERREFYRKKTKTAGSLQKICRGIINIREKREKLKKFLEQNIIVSKRERRKIDSLALENEFIKLENQEEKLGETYFKSHKNFELEFGKTLSH